MQSLSKTPVTQDLARRILTKHFGSSAKLANFQELTEGFYNAAYLIELTDGTKSVLKVAPPPALRVLRYEKDIMRVEVEVMRLVKTKTEIPVPLVLCYDSSHRLLESDFFIMEFVEGAPLHKIREMLSLDEQHDIDIQTGKYLRQMNAITGERFGSIAQPKSQSTNWRGTFDRLLRNVLADGQDAGVILPLGYESIHLLLEPHFDALDEIQTPCLVHWDLWDGNIFIDPLTKQISGIIDFERALWADPLMEVNFGAFSINPAFMEGYGSDMLATANQKRRRTLYNIYLFLIMVIECTYRKYENNDQENWSRMKLAEQFEILKSFQE
jgi:aminoglycoside phosphotransferase (APT) family kinase protein